MATLNFWQLNRLDQYKVRKSDTIGRLELVQREYFNGNK